MTIHIHNSLTGCKEKFKSLIPGKVRIYVCGMTVYDYCHLGHARVLVVFDMVVKVLRSIGYDVLYIRNITDIDDKIIKRANELNQDINTLTSRFIDAMHEDERLLNVEKPDQEPRATDYIENMISIIQELEKKGYAYQAKNGDVFFRVRKFPKYGRLSGRSLDDLQIGARVELETAKEDPLDFVLWKMAKQDEPSWSSPWGNGRPGWHIECSAMSMHWLDATFDIHGGGMDLQFPHHENEIAQSEGYTEKKFVNLWMHNGYVKIDKEKMSKSLGNFVTIRDVYEKFENKEIAGEVIRFMILQSHYRSPLNFTDDSLETSYRGLERLYKVLHQNSVKNDLNLEAESGGEFSSRFKKALQDDFNTPSGISILFELAREANRSLQNGDNKHSSDLACCLKHCGEVLGILYQDPEVFLGISVVSSESELIQDRQTIQKMIEDRNEARANKNYKLADNIRFELEKIGIVIEDLSDGTTEWKRV